MNISTESYLQYYMKNQTQNHYQMEVETIIRPYTRTYAAISLDAVRHNLKAMKANLNRGTGIIGVMKVDAYGHGTVPVARAIDEYVCGYAVATVEETMQLRRHGITKPVIIPGVTHEIHNREMIRYGIRSTIFTMDRAKKLSETAVSMYKPAVVHLALDAGTSHTGMMPVKESVDLTEAMSKLPSLQLEGLFTYSTKADEGDKTFAKQQIEQFQTFLNILEERGIKIPVKHCSNSTGIIDMKEVNFNTVRAGIPMYGLYPSQEVDIINVVLIPALERKGFVTYVKEIPEGAPVSYGGTFAADKKMTVATIPVGYGDGYPRNLSNKGSVLVHGEWARVLGRVCMDQMIVGVTDIPDVKVDDEVALIGIEEEDQITAMELAETGGGFHYEILCGINKRVPRVYLKGGQILGKKDYFSDRYEGPR